jgi:predicted house-cleaning noncanonical NTP pyrophosphatase (MazG superfamily)
MASYKKLVRDKIPDIIRSNGEEPIIRILDNKEYLKELNIKLQEEVNEYLESSDIEELADIMEVIIGILNAKESSYEELESIRKDKVLKRGSFNQRIYLDGVNNGN